MSYNLPKDKQVAGWWRRFFRNIIDSLMISITIGIYLIFIIINFIRAKQTIGMKVTKIKYSEKRQLALFLFNILMALFYCLIIPMIIDFFMICFKKGTFGERWSGNYYICE